MNILIPGGGDAVDLSPVNAAATDIRKGKVIVDANGNPMTGTMAEQAGGTYTASTADKTLVAANRYVTGNVVMKGDTNLKAANIKKGVKIFGITGTWEGWVPTATDLYLHGNNSGNLFATGTSSEKRNVTFDSGQITVTLTSRIILKTSNVINLAGKTRITIESTINFPLNKTGGGNTHSPEFALAVTDSPTEYNNCTEILNVKLANNATTDIYFGNKAYAFAQQSVTKYFIIMFKNLSTYGRMEGNIYKISLS